MAATIGKYAAGKFMSKQAKKDQANRLQDGKVSTPFVHLQLLCIRL